MRSLIKTLGATLSQAKGARGFTLLELMLVVAMIAILSAAVITAINPVAQLANTRNAQRKVDINTILSAVYQYTVDNNGALPATIASSTCASTDEICATGASSCTGLVDLSVLTNSQKYLVSIPIDPSGATTTYGTGYRISKNSYGRITVCAAGAESISGTPQVITVTR